MDAMGLVRVSGMGGKRLGIHHGESGYVGFGGCI